jgi:hypothetical protein
MTQHLNGKYKKERGILKPLTLSGCKQYEQFVSTIPDGAVVEFFYELQHDDGTLPQLAKLHAMLKPLASHIGETVENMKLLVKDRAGLCIAREVSGKEYFLAKSFGECSKEELSLAIQAAIEIGQEVNFLVG